MYVDGWDANDGMNVTNCDIRLHDVTRVLSSPTWREPRSVMLLQLLQLLLLLLLLLLLFLLLA